MNLQCTRFSNMTIARILLFTFVVVVLTGCGGDLTDAQYVAKAKEHIETKHRNSAIIELKNALQQNANNKDARLLLAKVYLDMGNYAAAEKELLRAMELGVPQNELAAARAQILIGSGKYKDVQNEVRIKDDYDTDLKARLYYYRGKAQLNMANIDAAADEFQNAMHVSKDSPYAMLGQSLLAFAHKDFEMSDSWITKAEQAGLKDSVETMVIRSDLAMAQEDYKKAETLLHSAIKHEPYNIPLKIVLVIAQINLNELDKANENLDVLLKLFPTYPVANYLKAQVAYKQKDFNTAINYSEKALAIAPNYLQSRLIAGAANYGAGNYEQANEHLKKFVNTIPDNIPARKLLAATQLKLGFTGDAAKTLGDLKPEDINDSKLIEAIGLASLKTGDVESGKKYLEKATELQPESATARARLGLARINTGEIKEGIADLEEAIRLNPKLQEAELALALTYLRTKNYTKALEVVGNFQKNFPKSPHGYTLEGVIQAAQGKKVDAVKLFEKALALDPLDISANSNMAAIALQNADIDKARTYLLKALEKNKSHLQTLIKLAQIEYQAKNEEKAVDYLNRAIEANPGAVQPRIILGRYFLNKREPVKALETTSKVIDTIEDPNLLEIAGRAQLQLGRGNEAVITFKKLVNQQPKSVIAHWNLARAYMKTGNFSSAEASLNTALQIDPDHKPSLYQKVKLLAATNQLEKAKTVLAKLKQGEPNNTYIQELEAIIAFIDKDYTKSVELYKKALSKRATNILTIRLATAMTLAGDTNGGLEVLKQWLEKYPQDILTRTTYADALLTNKQYKAAREQYLKVIKVSKENIPVLNNLAWINMQLNDLDAAVDFAGQASIKAPNDPFINDTYASILIRQQEFKRALDLLRNASTNAPKDLDIQFHLAQALNGVGKKQEAITILKKITQSENVFTERENAIKLLQKLS